MLIAVLSDIHANATALECVLLEARKSNVEYLFVLGDLVGYYYEANRIFTLLDGWKKNVIRGNHEDMLLGLLDGAVDPDFIRRKYGSGLNIAATSLPSEVLSVINNLKRSETVSIDGLNMILAHGTPWSTDEYIYPDSDRKLLERCEGDGIDYVFLGHTHYPLIYTGRYTTIINPGSVGQSRVRGGIAHWGILNTSNNVYRQKETVFDTEALKESIRKIDPDIPYLRTILERV